MIFGFEEASKNGRRYYEFKYKTIVRRKEKSESFKCFQGNNLQIFEYEQSIFMESENDYNYLFGNITSIWVDHSGIHSYIPLGIVRPKQGMSASDVVSLIYKRNDFKYLAQMTTIGSIDYIQ